MCPIVSFYVPIQSDMVIKDELEACCRSALPSYMVPQVFISVVNLPTGSSGKYDFKKLREQYLNSDKHQD